MTGEFPASARYRSMMLHQAHDFYRYPADYVNPSWLDDDPHRELFEQLRQRSGSRKYLSDYILERYRLSAGMDCDFAQGYQRLSLLSGDQLLQIIMLGGLLAYSSRIPKRAEVVALPADLHRFAVAKAPFLVKSAPTYCIDVGIADWEDQELVERGVRIAGLNMLACALTDVPPSVRKRLALKLPRPLGNLCEAAFGRDCSPEQTLETRRLMLKLYREADPSCYLLFD